MAKGVPNQRYTPEFKKHVVETMIREGLSYRETEKRYELPHMRAAAWERIYLEEGSEGFLVVVDEAAPEDHASCPKWWKRIFWQRCNGCERRMNT